MELIKTLKTTLEIKFPLQDGSFLVRGIDPGSFNFPVRYAMNRLITGHNADFMQEDKFVEASRLARQTLNISPQSLPNSDPRSWNTYVCCWAASHAKNLPGDFVECGVNTGMYSTAVIHYIDFNRTGKTFFLCDTFTGIPEEQVTPEEAEFYKNISADVVKRHNSENYTRDIYEDVKEQFKDYNVKLIRGKVPDTLSLVDAEKICYLSIDMNIVAPEIAAAEYFWDKIVPGGVIVLDDYGWSWHLPQKKAFDKFAENRSVKVLPLPTGQGLIFKQ